VGGENGGNACLKKNKKNQVTHAAAAVAAA